MGQLDYLQRIILDRFTAMIDMEKISQLNAHLKVSATLLFWKVHIRRRLLKLNKL